MNYKRKLVPQMPVKGWHFATITSIKEDKSANIFMGMSEKALITFNTDNYSLVTQSFLMGLGTSLMLEKLITVTMGQGVEEINLEDLVGKRCGIKVEHRFSKDRVFANVVDVCSVDD